ncbi:uncharacterized protein LOC120289688 [Eucalyptus grandis]|uniref:uncharacterized protein LOC120289688 n=1 Tax=Eucalyptus grandis TaxID=71139 RepID=UPI00192EE1B0|nr:uncharacterized protein LOC120289688 [Eucalyptus grandis]
MARSSCFYMSINLLFLYLWSHPIGAHNLSRSVKPLCLENEISALLQFKERYDIANVSRGPLTRPKILSWNKGRDCCSWDGIECDENTGHVIILNLRSSFLYGSIDSNSTLFQLAHLEKLDLSDNHFNYSQIPSRIGDLLRLTYLNVSYSVFSGRVPSEIFKLTRLVYLDLCCNLDPYTSTRLLEMQPLGLRSLAQNVTSLEVLSLGVVAMSAKVPNTLANLSSLRALQMDVCDLHGVFPSAIFNLPKLIYLGVADNKALIGQLPYFNSSSPLKQLRVPGTSFSESYPLQSKINLYGEIPPSIGNLSQLVELSFLGNQLSGTIPSLLRNLTRLTTLYLRSNQLSGQYQRISHDTKPKRQQFLRKHSELLVRGTRLMMLDLSDNQLQGNLPRSLANCKMLEFINFANNLIVDSFPSWLGSLPELRVLILRSNKFHHVIERPQSSQTFLKLRILDLSINAFVGKLPVEFFHSLNGMKSETGNFTYMHKNLLPRWYFSFTYYGNYDFSMTMIYKGLVLYYPKISKALTVIDLSSNLFEGEILGAIGDLKGLQGLNLSNNLLTFGQIPPLLGNLKALESLDLSLNKLSGQIPQKLTELGFLSVLNMSYNNLTGSVPRGKQFDTFSNDSFKGNSGLCGEFISTKCQDSEDKSGQPSTHQEEGLGSAIELDWKIVLLGYGSGLVIGVVLGNAFISGNMIGLKEMPGRRRPSRSHLGGVGTLGLPIDAHILSRSVKPLCLEDEMSALLQFKESLDDRLLLEMKALGLRRLSQNLTGLEELLLGHVNMSSQVPNTLANLSSLRRLNMDVCDLHGIFPPAIFHLPKLQYISVDDNEDLTGRLPNFNSSSPLKELQLGDTSFYGELPASIGNLRSLEMLDLNSCNLTGSLPMSIGNLPLLSYLDIGHNNFSGSIPASFANLSNLKNLDVGMNPFAAQSASSLSWVWKMKKLATLNLWRINLYGEIPPSIGNLSQLVELSFFGNQLSGTIPSQLMNLTQLTDLRLQTNQLSGSIPSWLVNMTQLVVLDLSRNKFHGQIPSSIYQLQNLQVLRLFENNFSGTVELDNFLKLKQLEVLQLSSNRLSCRTSSANVILPQLEVLGLASCNLREFPAFLQTQKDMNWLDLSDNNITGEVPFWVWDGRFKKMQYLNLSHNFLTGLDRYYPINPLYMYTIDLSHIMLKGPLPEAPLSIVSYIVSNNRLTGALPPWSWNAMKSKMGNFSYMHKDLHPSAWLSYTYYGDYDFSMIVIYKGLKWYYPKILDVFTVINLSSNSFEGEIPGAIGDLKGLHGLNLSNNFLTGHIPSSLGNLTALESLDLSRNKLWGQIPTKLIELGFLSFLNLSCNNLTGSVPKGKQFDMFTDDSFKGNTRLCGEFISMKCRNLENASGQPSTQQEEDLGSPSELNWKIVLMGYGSGLVIGVVIGNALISWKHHPSTDAASPLSLHPSRSHHRRHSAGHPKLRPSRDPHRALLVLPAKPLTPTELAPEHRRRLRSSSRATDLPPPERRPLLYSLTPAETVSILAALTSRDTSSPSKPLFVLICVDPTSRVPEPPAAAPLACAALPCEATAALAAGSSSTRRPTGLLQDLPLSLPEMKLLYSCFCYLDDKV